jgi:hypothetical protein
MHSFHKGIGGNQQLPARFDGKNCRIIANPYRSWTWQASGPGIHDSL